MPGQKQYSKMGWLNTDSKRHPQELQVSGVQFLGEQGGVPERKLKDSLTDFFQRDRSIRAAYLSRVVYSEPSAFGCCPLLVFGVWA